MHEGTDLVFIVDFKSLFNALFPSSLQTCQLRFQACFQVRKLGANFATKFASTFQCLNFVCKQMFILNNNNQFNEIQTFLVDHWTKDHFRT
jgi:hypothetical protein